MALQKNHAFKVKKELTNNFSVTMLKRAILMFHKIPNTISSFWDLKEESLNLCLHLILSLHNFLGLAFLIKMLHILREIDITSSFWWLTVIHLATVCSVVCHSFLKSTTILQVEINQTTYICFRSTVIWSLWSFCFTMTLSLCYRGTSIINKYFYYSSCWVLDLEYLLKQMVHCFNYCIYFFNVQGIFRGYFLFF